MREKTCEGSILNNTACGICSTCLENAVFIIKELRHRSIAELAPKEYIAMLTSLTIAYNQLGHQEFESIRRGVRKDVIA